MAKKSNPGKLELAQIMLEKTKAKDFNPKDLGLNPDIIQELDALVKEVKAEKEETEKITSQLKKKKEEISGKVKNIGRILKTIRKMFRKDISKKVIKEMGFGNK